MSKLAMTAESAERIARRVKLNDLRLLRAVVERGGMAKAALYLNMSQPGVSKAIASLEATLGVRLLDRHATGVEPTVHGEALLRGGAAVFDELRKSVAEVRFLADPTAGELRIGCGQPLSYGLVSAVIEQMNRKYSGIRLVAVEGETAPLQNRELQQRQIEMVIGRIESQGAVPDMETEALFNDRLFVAVGVRSPWARRRSIALADLCDASWILPPYRSIVGELIRASFQDAGLPAPHPTISTYLMPVQLSMMASGRYVSVLPQSVIHFSARRLGIRALPITLRHPPSSVGIITLKNRTLSPLAEVFITHARQLAQSLAKGA